MVPPVCQLSMSSLHWPPAFPAALSQRARSRRSPYRPPPRTVSMPVPTANEHAIGTAIVSNVTVQYFIAFYFWPEFAFNDTYWASGVRGGKNQLFLSPGIVFGRFVLFDRLKAVFGINYQFAVLPEISKTPVLTPV